MLHLERCDQGQIVNVRVDDDVYNLLKRLSEVSELSISDIVRMCLVMYILKMYVGNVPYQLSSLQYGTGKRNIFIKLKKRILRKIHEIARKRDVTISDVMREALSCLKMIYE